MADARTLLRAKRQEARISHPLASYNNTGQLRCIICGTLVKFASAWEGHLGSKAHRTNVARVKEEERLRDEARAREEAATRAAEEEEKAGIKRKAQVVEDDDDDEEESDSTAASKKPKLDGTAAGFPADFFSDPSRAPVVGADSDNDDEGEEQKPVVPAQPPSAIDLEYERFQRELLKAQEGDARETYERATVIAEPDLLPEVPEGFPAPAGTASEAQEEKPEFTEEEKRQQKDMEEKELIMDRLLEEERAQEEVDMKVQMMKNRLNAFKKQREATRAAKAAKQTSW